MNVVLPGDEVYKRIEPSKKPHLGTVVYVNYQWGWYTAEFEVSGSKIRECFYMRELESPESKKKDSKNDTKTDSTDGSTKLIERLW